ncbi:hypothetical protein EUGRSUZ_E03153 [Eucalyptus grandis]|uniref:Uncharacterized protein n=2 Tax=Eucalyptus grandis TaxID=71139 RepID=A0A059C7Z7_EUCGR|nr:hypothetical protein EUGRSUZ_E03153 [Eucalyptus grandis]
MVDVVRLSSLRFSSSPSSSSLTPSSSRQRGALCPPPHKLHRWSDASANCSHGGGVAGLGFGTRKRFASLKVRFFPFLFLGKFSLLGVSYLVRAHLNELFVVTISVLHITLARSCFGLNRIGFFF